MSIETWKAEFYRVSEKGLDHDSKQMTDLQAVEHALHKWKGALPEALDKHKLSWQRGSITDPTERFYFGGDNCALCQKYEVAKTQDCYPCPLYRHLGKACDDSDNPLDYRNSSLDLSLFARSKYNPRYMVDVLTELADELRKEAANGDN